MNLADLVKTARDAAPSRMSDAHATAIVEAIFGGITAALARGEEVRIKDFGAFGAVRRAAGKGRNLHTGEELDIPAKQVARFKPFTALKDALNPTPRVGSRRMSPASGERRARA
jgi:DNA-binding protein HU-beta